MSKITVNSIIRRNDEQFVSTQIDDELVMMDIQNGNYIKLNKMANIIWEQIKEPLSVNQLIKYLETRFFVNEDQCQNETLSCLDRMNEHNLIWT